MVMVRLKALILRVVVARVETNAVRPALERTERAEAKVMIVFAMRKNCDVDIWGGWIRLGIFLEINVRKSQVYF